MAAASAQPLPFSTVAAVRSIPAERLAGRPAVRLRGVVTFYDGGEGYIYLEDGTGFIFLEPTDFWPSLTHVFAVAPGSRVEVEGFAVAGLDGPHIEAAVIREISRGPLPPPARLDYRSAARPEMDGAYVTLQGVVRSATVQRHARSRLLALELLVDEHIVYVAISEWGGLSPTELLDATVTATGNQAPYYGPNKKIVGLGLNVASRGDLSVVRPARVPLLSTPQVPLGEIVDYSTSTGQPGRVRTRGVATLYYPGDELVLKDGADTLEVRTLAQDEFAVGSEVEVTGFPAIVGKNVELHWAQVLEIGGPVKLLPRKVSFADALSGTYNGDFVALDGDLVSETHDEAYDVLFLNTDEGLFQAVYNKSQLNATRIPDYEAGSRLRVAGVCFSRKSGFLADEEHFQLGLRSPAGVTLVAPPSWWNIRHIVTVSVAVLLATVVALVWVLFLRQRAVRQLAHLAEHDALTGLPNRLLLAKRLEMELQAARRRRLQIAVFFLDMDRFKQINDTLGHAAGDQVLCQTARRLVESLRNLDTVGRIGGDEFVAILPGAGSYRETAALAEKLLTEAARPYLVANTTISPCFSLGISLYPQDGETAEALLELADGALFRAKELGRNRFCFCATDGEEGGDPGGPTGDGDPN